MTKNQEYLRTALAMVGVTANDMSIEMIDETFMAIRKKGGSFTLDEATTIRFNIEEKYKKIAEEKKQQS